MTQQKNEISLAPQRLEWESFEDYKARQKIANKASKQRIVGLSWDSYNRGTYENYAKQMLKKQKKNA